ncbi:helix-turn-helix transcriptional regulator [Clostridioides sp. ZZV14-6154]|uniref:winged helix-turn-helix transcriptional regulator n=1 Tax=unclassified Clostridioides TaxID=2635829 RepID=UPI001DB63958|nr:helix-turn-helix transcriptional regulator [Clostridioides sp. ZZV15-6388]MCC0660499.1 helix-turn-helix transcriptional regulator [Clostridioides sp. ZZV14-6154]MCC0666292.1 helix-turn-helix transcriptional regulator [Clostridioides sp. ZZV15-6597]
MKIYQEISPKVEYSLTDLGISFLPVLEHMKQWAKPIYQMIKVIDLHIFKVRNIFPSIYDTMLNKKIKTLY